MKTVFMGTPEIAVASLEALHKDGQEIIAVVTAPDKPAGRGRQVQSPPVKEFALKHQIKILQPENLKSSEFLKELSTLAPELIIVVAFRMLPEEVWSLPARGTINLHASMLPQYRGAAPINRAIMNGETETGVSTFFIEKDIDSGKIIMQEPVQILPDDNAGTLHDRIIEKGTDLLLRTVRAIKNGDPPFMNQADLMKPGEVLKTAPKIFKEDCRIHWDRPVKSIYDQVRGLSPEPGAWTLFVSPDGQERIVKVYEVDKMERESMFQPGTILTDGRSRFEVVCRNGIINLTRVQIEGKKKMPIDEFLRGIKNAPEYIVK